VRRAVRKRTEFGRGAAVSIWVNYEYEALCALYDAGADVPEPYASDDRALLMEYVGDGSAPAQQLQYVKLTPEEAPALWDRLLWNVGLWLSNNQVHADLSAFNVLYWRGKLKVIDFPQAVDPRFNRSARSLLERDLRNLAKYFERYGLEVDSDRIAADLWRRWQNGGGG
jgi:RIO kinase 1